MKIHGCGRAFWWDAEFEYSWEHGTFICCMKKLPPWNEGGPMRVWGNFECFAGLWWCDYPPEENTLGVCGIYDVLKARIFEGTGTRDEPFKLIK